MRRWTFCVCVCVGSLFCTTSDAARKMTTFTSAAFKKSWSKKKFSHRLLDRVLRKYVRISRKRGSSRVNYARLRADQKAMKRLREYLYRLSRTNWRTLRGRKQKFAFLINAYNAITLRAVLDRYPKSKAKQRKFSVLRSVKKFWKNYSYELGGKWKTLDQIENKMMRPYFKDARLHFVLVCAAIGCPALWNRAYTPSRLSGQLNRATRSFLSSKRGFRLDRAKKQVTISKLFQWYRGDFLWKKDKHELLYIARYLPKRDAAFVRKHYRSLKIKYSHYNWSLNQRW